MTNELDRKSDYSINEQFTKRWSPRAFRDEEVPEELIFRTLEAARWAPSSMNIQPWRFIVARTKEDREKFHSFIMEGNRVWCENAPVLILFISEKKGGSHAFDTGISFGFFALQALENGLVTHPMGGFDKEKARDVLGIPDNYQLHAVVALGYQGDKASLSPELQERETPSTRRPLKESIHQGTF
ncbi:nitroreductase family protein [Paraliobacillus salinarum]|uniref:nitroreductase family protein n=1 Tax=Paraliobacillus salinarum TaxID=1158996 RepID=UPI0015F61956|nr:nitroreductase family protein [Paraliobacillus salinarum]